MKTQCPFCKRNLTVENRLDGKDLNCPSCGEEFIAVSVIEKNNLDNTPKLDNGPKLDNANDNMIDCPSCAKKVYKYKKNCPHCGNKIKRNKRKTKLEDYCVLPSIGNIEGKQKTKFDDLCIILGLGSFVFGISAIPSIICGIIALRKKALSIQSKVKIYIGLSISILFLGFFIFLIEYVKWDTLKYEKMEKEKNAKRKASIAKAKEDKVKADKARFEAEKKSFVDNIEKHYAEFLAYHRSWEFDEVVNKAIEFDRYGQIQYKDVYPIFCEDRERQVLQMFQARKIDGFVAYRELLKVRPDNKTYQLKFAEFKKKHEDREKYNQMLKSLGSIGVKNTSISNMFYKIQKEGESPSDYIKYIIKTSGSADKRIKVANILDDYVIYSYSYFGRELFQFQFAMPRNKNKIYLEDQCLKPGYYLVANHAMFKNALGTKFTLLILKPVNIDININNEQ
jgi:predicted RNA-binding Zn-ribbon protein involved in translation (DUF1610 family)